MNKQKIDLSKPFIVASGKDVLIQVNDGKTDIWHELYVAYGNGKCVYCWPDGSTSKDHNCEIKKAFFWPYSRHIPEITDEKLHALVMTESLWWKSDDGGYLHVKAYYPKAKYKYLLYGMEISVELSWFRNREYTKTPPFKSPD